MKQIIGLPALSCLAVLLSCSSDHLITDRSLREEVSDDYRARSEIFAVPRGDLFALADTVSDRSLREAVTFLLAYMPLSDMAVYEPGYLLENASAALRAREEMPWGRSVPPEIFLNFVLPPRVNNENPDDFRTAVYGELSDRVSGLDAMDAALEINRWCQEKVSYQPADIRTSSPLATILSARGRCGEESTFTVSALRTVGIPARQVYTPRWAHTDDNHAWVEFWVDGAWHYLGACEPEPVPDRGWFTEPARRAMMVHTKAYGKYKGNEKVIRRAQLFTELNTLERYAETKELKIRVTDEKGLPRPGAVAGFLLYNYAEFYPLAWLTCDVSGECSLVTGHGSLLIWADDGEKYGFALSMPDDTVLNVALSSPVPVGALPLDLQVPVVPEPYPPIDPELVRVNNIKLRRGDSLRTAYTRTWMTGVNAGQIAGRAGIPEEKVREMLVRAMGNYREIADFITGAGDRAGLALRILESISDKDLRDTRAEVLADHLNNAPAPAPGSDQSLYDSYVLSPRISNEILSAFRNSFSSLPAGLIDSFRSDPAKAVAWTDTTIAVTEGENHYSVPLTPGGVMRLGMADGHSRDIFFVALCRSAGIPARLAPGTGRPQYNRGGVWHDAWFSDQVKPSGTPGFIRLVSDGNDREPEYHVHFTLARLENGRFSTLDYGYGEKISSLPDRLSLDPGNYMLTTGNRDDNGNVMASLSFFELKPDQELIVNVALRRLPETDLTTGTVTLAPEIETAGGEKYNLSSLSDDGLVIIWLEPGKEPTRHILNELPAFRSEFNEWGGQFLFLTDPQSNPDGLAPGAVPGLPENSIFGTDEGMKIMSSLLGGNSSDRPLPVVLCCDSEGKVLFTSEGYRIGTAGQILKKIGEK
jgi:hypothetical protein